MGEPIVETMDSTVDDAEIDFGPCFPWFNLYSLKKLNPADRGGRPP